MRILKYILLSILLFASGISFAQTYSNTGTSNLQRAPTAKGYIYRNNMGALGNVNWYTAAQLDSLFGLLPPPGAALLKANNLSDVNNAATSLANINGVSLLGSYANPSWITSLAWGKITGTPTTLGGYGITDGITTTTFNTTTGTSTLSLLAGKQATLVSGTNIKTVNSTSLLGSGDIPFPTSLPTPFAATFNNSGSGAASGTTFDGSTARTISYNTIGAQPTGNYITFLIGDGTASGPGSATLTLATVNANTGSFGTASNVPTITYNGKGLATSVVNTPIQIAESQVTNLPADLAATVKYTDTAALQAKNTLQKITTNGDSTTNIPKMAGLHVGSPPTSKLFNSSTPAKTSLNGGLVVLNNSGESARFKTSSASNVLNIQNTNMNTSAGNRPSAIAFLSNTSFEMGATGYVHQDNPNPGTIYKPGMFFAASSPIDSSGGRTALPANRLYLIQEGRSLGGHASTWEAYRLMCDSDGTMSMYTPRKSITWLQDTLGNWNTLKNINSYGGINVIGRSRGLRFYDPGASDTTTNYAYVGETFGTGGFIRQTFAGGTGVASAQLFTVGNTTSGTGLIQFKISPPGTTPFAFAANSAGNTDPIATFLNANLPNGNYTTVGNGHNGGSNNRAIWAFVQDATNSRAVLAVQGNDFNGAFSGVNVYKNLHVAINQADNGTDAFQVNGSILGTSLKSSGFSGGKALVSSGTSIAESSGTGYIKTTSGAPTYITSITKSDIDTTSSGVTTRSNLTPLVAAYGDGRYLKLTGGSLTGTLIGINATFTGGVTGTDFRYTGSGITTFDVNNTGSQNYIIRNGASSTLFTLNNSGNGLFAGTLTASGLAAGSAGNFVVNGGSGLLVTRTASQVLSDIGAGTVTSITPGWGFTSSTPIINTGTLVIDSAKVQTIGNFFTKGNTKYGQLAASNSWSNTNIFGNSTTFNSGSTFNSAIAMNQQITHNSGYQDVYYNSANTFNAVFGVNTLTGNRTATLPDKDGTLVVSTQLPIHGNSTTTGTATTVVTVTIGSTMANTTYNTTITPRDLLTAVNYYISAQTTTTFDVTFISALTGSINFDYCITP